MPEHPDVHNTEPLTRAPSERRSRRVPVLALAALLASLFALTTATAASAAPTCSSADADPDGDGWGWENNQSCEVADVSIPSNLADCDYSEGHLHGGWGWNPVTSESCAPVDDPSVDDEPVVSEPAPQPVASTDSDCDYSEGHLHGGWGWNPVTNESCAPVDDQPAETESSNAQLATPQAPTAIVSGVEVNLSWPEVGRADGYNVYRNGNFVKWTNATSWTDAPSEAGVYEYTINAFGTAPGSKTSAATSVVLLPALPADPKLDVAADSQLQITWQPLNVSGIDVSYEVRQDGKFLTSTSGTQVKVPFEKGHHEITVVPVVGGSSIQAKDRTTAQVADSTSDVVGDLHGPMTPSVGSYQGIELTWHTTVSELSESLQQAQQEQNEVEFGAMTNLLNFFSPQKTSIGKIVNNTVTVGDQLSLEQRRNRVEEDIVDFYNEMNQRIGDSGESWNLGTPIFDPLTGRLGIKDRDLKTMTYLHINAADFKNKTWDEVMADLREFQTGSRLPAPGLPDHSCATTIDAAENCNPPNPCEGSIDAAQSCTTTPGGCEDSGTCPTPGHNVPNPGVCCGTITTTPMPTPTPGGGCEDSGNCPTPGHNVPNPGVCCGTITTTPMPTPTPGHNVPNPGVCCSTSSSSDSSSNSGGSVGTSSGGSVQTSSGGSVQTR